MRRPKLKMSTQTLEIPFAELARRAGFERVGSSHCNLEVMQINEVSAQIQFKDIVPWTVALQIMSLLKQAGYVVKAPKSTKKAA